MLVSWRVTQNIKRRHSIPRVSQLPPVVTGAKTARPGKRSVPDGVEREPGHLQPKILEKKLCYFWLPKNMLGIFGYKNMMLLVYFGKCLATK